MARPVGVGERRSAQLQAFCRGGRGRTALPTGPGAGARAARHGHIVSRHLQADSP
jgi:hypothetical protein